jgi:hypothetical protein
MTQWFVPGDTIEDKVTRLGLRRVTKSFIAHIDSDLKPGESLVRSN